MDDEYNPCTYPKPYLAANFQTCPSCGLRWPGHKFQEFNPDELREALIVIRGRNNGKG